MILKILTLLFITVLILVDAHKVSYDNYTLYKISPKTDRKYDYLKRVLEQNDNIKVMKEATTADDFASVLVPPELNKEFQHSLHKRSISSEVLVNNLQEVLNAELFSRKRRDASNRLYWTNYQTLEDINEWLENLSREHSDVVSIVEGGESYQGRKLLGVKISKGSGRKAIVIQGGMIGADWLSPTVATFVINQLVNGDDDEARKASEEFDWYIFPVLNPDGFEYSENVDRMWIKNRRPFNVAAVGIDLTKNWNSQWGVRGGSYAATSDSFIGLGPFSEPETRSFSSFISTLSGDLIGFFSLRGFGQKLLIPFAHTTSSLYNYDEMLTIGRRAMGSLAVRYGTQYTVGTSAEIHDGATGDIVDWVKYRFNPPLAATFLLRDDGTWGHVLPVVNVEPTCEETFDGLLAIIREAKYLNVV